MLNPLVRDINYFAYSGQVLIILGQGGGLLVCSVSIFVQSSSLLAMRKTAEET